GLTAAKATDEPGEAAWQEDGPGHDPESEIKPEEPDGSESVVVGDALGEEAGDVLVVEIEPGPASCGGEAEIGGKSDGWVAESGEYVPGRGDEQEGSGAGEE